MNLIVAVDKNWGIGKDGTMPWHISADLKYFKEKTIDKTVIMGRKTLLSFPKQSPLPKRENIIISSNTTYSVEGATVVNSIDALEAYTSDDTFVIGGGSIYRKLLPYCEYAYITKIDSEFDCDTHFTNLDVLDNWEIKQEGEPLCENGITFRFTVYKNLAVKPFDCGTYTEDSMMEDYNEKMPPMDEVDLSGLELLCEVENDFEADVKISLLRSCSIMAFKRYSQFGAVAKIYCGSSNLGVMIYVPKDKLEEALEILAAPFDSSELEEN